MAKVVVITYCPTQFVLSSYKRDIVFSFNFTDSSSQNFGPSCRVVWMKKKEKVIRHKCHTAVRLGPAQSRDSRL